MKDADVARFWSKVQKLADDACWPWLGGCHREGYGAFRVDDTTVLTHRIVWTLTHGDIPPGRNVRIRCRNRACCNPGHLFTTPHGKLRASSWAIPLPQAA